MHTPGPWICDWLDDENGWVLDSDGNYLATICTEDEEGRFETSPERRAGNARLMAAAPEFLAVCRGLIQAYEFGLKNGGSVRWEDMDDVHRMALAAVEGLGEKSG